MDVPLPFTPEQVYRPDSPVETSDVRALLNGMIDGINSKADTTAVADHTDATDNPHGVTKAQVGLGNADDTSDADKPVSTATQTALAMKADTADVTASHLGRETVLAGSHDFDSRIVLLDAAPLTTMVSSMEVSSEEAQTITVEIWTKSGSLFSRTDSQDVEVTAGIQTVPLSLAIAEGQFIGVDGNIRHTRSGATASPYQLGDGNEDVAEDNTQINLDLEVKFTLEPAGFGFQFAKAEDRITALEAGGSGGSGADTVTYIGAGIDELVDAGTAYTRDLALNLPADRDTRVTSMDISVSQAGDFIAGVYTDNGDGTLTRTASQTVTLVAGINLGIALDVPIAEGQLVGGQGFWRYFGNGDALHNPYQAATGVLIGTNTAVTPTGVAILLQARFTLSGENTGSATVPATVTQPWAGLKWAALGTSITDQGRYTGPLNTALGTVLTNAGVSGGCIAETMSAGSLAIHDAVPSIPADASLVTVEAGANDFANNAVLGAYGDTTTATFYGALFDTVGDIRVRAPNAIICLFTPYGGSHTSYDYIGTNGNGNNLHQFQQAVRNVCDGTGAILIDVARYSTIGYHTSGALLTDGIHQDGESGGPRMAAFLAEELNKIGRVFGTSL